MVKDRLTDGKRIAQLLASELDARENGPLARVAVVDADREATPSEDGTEAYTIAVDESPVGTVTLFPDHASVRLETAVEAVLDAATEHGLDAERDSEGIVVRVESGAAVKRAVDTVAATIPD